MENKSPQKGVITALMAFLTGKLNKKLYISRDEELTKDGLTWILKLANQQWGGLKLTDSKGNKIDPVSLQKEWSKAYSDSSAGPTEIFIENNDKSISNRLTEQSGFMMPYIFYIGRTDLI